MILAERRKNTAVPAIGRFASELTGKEMEIATGGLDTRTILKILGKEAKKEYLCSTIASHDYVFTGRERKENQGSRAVRLRERRCRRCGCSEWVAEAPGKEEE